MSNESNQPVQLKTYKHVAGNPDIRRIVLNSASEGRFLQLLGKLTSAYKTNDSLLVYWKDSDGDFVSMSNDDDLQLAVRAAKGGIVKLYLVDANGKHVVDEFGDATAKQSEAGASTSARGSSGVPHPHVICDGCKSPIVGRRFKCVECPNYDLCERCELVENRHPEHNLMLIRRPSSRRGPYMRAGPFPWGFGFRGRGRRCGGPMSGAPWWRDCESDACPQWSCQQGATPSQAQMDTSADAAAESTQADATAQPSERTGKSYESELKSLLEMGFDSEGLEQLLAARHGNVAQVLDMLMGGSMFGQL